MEPTVSNVCTVGPDAADPVVQRSMRQGSCEINDHRRMTIPELLGFQSMGRPNIVENHTCFLNVFSCAASIGRYAMPDYGTLK